MKLFSRKPRLERRERGFTSWVMQLRGDYLAGHEAVAELSATAQMCISMWEQGLAVAECSTPLLTPDVLALTARSLGARGEALWIIDDDRLVPVDTYDLTTASGRPRAYRVTIPDVGGGTTTTALAAEVLHFRIGCNASTPWRGSPPLHRAQLTTGLLNAVEATLSDTFRNAPIGSQIVAMPETSPGDNDKLAASFRGKRGRVLLRESVNVGAAGGPAPTMDWKPSNLTPNLRDSMLVESWRDARNSVMAAFGVLPALVNGQATGPLVREAQRHLAQWTLTPIAKIMAAEVAAKLSADVSIDVGSPLHAYDAGGRARTVNALVQAIALAKQSGVTPDEVAGALKFAGVPDM